MRLTQTISFQSPAKVNFFLNILKKREDGYHELFMDLVPISLYDEIRFEPNPNETLTFKSNMKEVEKEKNLVVKAVRKLEEQIQESIFLTIYLHKKIPTGAGLGGGSGNAGGTLTVLNQLLQLEISSEKLSQLALSIGADVPFFLDPKPVRAKGIGEIFTPVPPFSPLPLLLLYPSFSVSTAEAYANCFISGRTESISSYSLESSNDKEWGANDFWPKISESYPQLSLAKKALLDSGAVSAGMSGSGSTLFGVYPSVSQRDQAFQKLQEEHLWSFFPCETLNHYHYI